MANVREDALFESRRPSIMPRLLVSVRDATEATAALVGGADIIDLKEPKRGSLGAVDPQIVADVVGRLGESVDGPPLSLAMGELADQPFSMVEQLKSDLFVFAKVGLAGTAEMPHWKAEWSSWAERLPSHVQPVFVVYVDWQTARTAPPIELLHFATEMAREGKVSGLLFDTWRKDAGNLFAENFPIELGSLFNRARDAGLWTALAGSLNAQTVADAMVMCPDIVAVRGAVCSGGREGVVQSEAVAEFRSAMSAAAKA